MHRYLLLSMILIACTTQPPRIPPPARQNPSPMVDSTRAHQRLEQGPVAGRRYEVDGVLTKPVSVLVTPAAEAAEWADLVIHFHGAPWLPMQAAAATGRPLVIAAVNAGAGSRAYEIPFADHEVFVRLRERISSAAPRIENVYLTGFSAGYGAIRAILRQQPEAIRGVLLLDGLHTSYVPEETPLAEGGALDVSRLEPFLRYAIRAANGESGFVITHSEIFPGTFASTTETADYLLSALGLRRTPVLKWGPLGMQQLSEAGQRSLHVLGFAGNTAPDHVDHLHGYQQFLERLLSE